MRILGNIENAMQIIGLCTISSALARTRQIIIFSFVMVVQTFKCTASLVYIHEHMRIGDLENSVYALFHVAAPTGDMGCMTAMKLQMENVKKIFDEMQSLYDQFVDGTSRIYFERANEMSATFFKGTMIFILGSFTFTSIAFAVGGMIFYYMRDGYVDPIKLYLPYRISSPFDETTHGGFICSAIVNQLMGLTYASTSIVINSYFISLGLYFQACSNHFRMDLATMSDIVNDREGYHSEKSMRLKRTLIAAVKFHHRIKEIFVMASEVMSGTIFIQIFIGILYMPATNFEMEMMIMAVDFKIVFLVLVICTSTGSVFLYCFMGTFTTEQFFEYGDSTYDSMWYKFPVDLQKHLQMTIANAHRPCIFNGFHIIDLHLTAFARLMNTVVSYHLMLKKTTA